MRTLIFTLSFFTALTCVAQTKQEPVWLAKVGMGIHIPVFTLAPENQVASHPSGYVVVQKKGVTKKYTIRGHWASKKPIKGERNIFFPDKASMAILREICGDSECSDIIAVGSSLD